MSGLPDYAEALAQALGDVRSLGRVESIDLKDAGGRVLAEPVVADRDLPPFNRAQMDGYAIRASEFVQGKAWSVSQRIAAGQPADVGVGPGECVAIATGAPLPDGLDAVIQHERTDRGDLRGQPVRFAVDSLEKGHAVHHRGADAKRGQTLIEAGTVLGAHHLGIAAAVGATVLPVRAKPQAMVCTSGDEVVAAMTSTSAIRPHQIRNSNSPQVMELLTRFGAAPIDAVHLADELEVAIDSVRKHMNRCDLLITVGGVSAGERDHFPTAFDACGVVRSLHGASIQPGRPIIVGRAPPPPPSGCIVVGLPGNPVSVMACACLFVWPIVQAMLGSDSSLGWREVVLAQDVKPNAQRRAFRPAILNSNGSVTVPSWAGSGDLAHTAQTHGLVELPIQAEVVSAGTRLRFLPWP